MNHTVSLRHELCSELGKTLGNRALNNSLQSRVIIYPMEFTDDKNCCNGYSRIAYYAMGPMDLPTLFNCNIEYDYVIMS